MKKVIFSSVFVSIFTCFHANSQMCEVLNWYTESGLAVKKVVEIQLGSSVEVKNDSLYLVYKVTNQTSRNLLFFHMKSLTVEMDWSSLALDREFQKLKMDYPYPGCEIHIINSSNELPRLFRTDTGPREYDPDYNPYSYVLLRAGESKFFRKRINIGCYYLLGKYFELRLNYSSLYNKDFVYRFRKMQARNPGLRDYEMFVGTLESNRCPFTYMQSDDKYSFNISLIYESVIGSISAIGGVAKDLFFPYAQGKVDDSLCSQ